MYLSFRAVAAAAASAAILLAANRRRNGSLEDEDDKAKPGDVPTRRVVGKLSSGRLAGGKSRTGSPVRTILWLRMAAAVAAAVDRRTTTQAMSRTQPAPPAAKRGRDAAAAGGERVCDARRRRRSRGERTEEKDGGILDEKALVKAQERTGQAAGEGDVALPEAAAARRSEEVEY
jgi:hypothetical protein